MTLAEAFRVWKKAKKQLEKYEPELKAAAEILKPHFRESGKNSSKGIGYSLSSYKALDVALARAELGPKAAAKCTVKRTRETLSLLED